jgi:hypothetical protein
MLTSRQRKRLSLQRGELKRLAAPTGEGWKLVGTDDNAARRRGGGNPPDVLEVLSSSEDEDTTVVVEDEEDEEEQVEEEEAPEPEPVVKKKKPTNNRVVLELDQINKVFEQMVCRECSHPVKVSVRNICIASSIGIECQNEACGFLYHPEPPAGTSIHLRRPDNFERSTDYAVNVLYVLGFMSMGDGGTEAARLLGLLGLPNDTT